MDDEPRYLMQKALPTMERSHPVDTGSGDEKYFADGHCVTPTMQGNRVFTADELKIKDTM
eukprot:m.943284 g.943284  ORF g.943284 m.943284 type:complete len:60 (-) comp23839_c1_seq11:445-624(-)